MKVFPPFLLDTVNQCVWRLGDTAREERILLFSALARRRSPAKLMLLATCRPLDLK
jgi:hypothetical protein